MIFEPYFFAWGKKKGSHSGLFLKQNMDLFSLYDKRNHLRSLAVSLVRPFTDFNPLPPRRLFRLFVCEWDVSLSLSLSSSPAATRNKRSCDTHTPKGLNNFPLYSLFFCPKTSDSSRRAFFVSFLYKKNSVWGLGPPSVWADMPSSTYVVLYYTVYYGTICWEKQIVRNPLGEILLEVSLKM